MPEPSADDGTDKDLHRKVRRYSLICSSSHSAWRLGRGQPCAGAFLARQGNREAAIPMVVTVTPNRTSLGEELVLPGTVQAYIEAPI